MSDPNTYAQSFLDSIGMPISPENVTSILAYLQCGGNPSNLAADSGTPVRLALEHNSPRPVFGHAVGGSIGDCIANTSTVSAELIAAHSPSDLFKVPGGQAVQNAIPGLKELSTLTKALTSPTLWLRVGEFLLGGVLLVLGIYLMASESQAMSQIKSSAESAAVVAAAA